MTTNVNLAAPISALAFLGTGALIGLTVISLVVSLIARRFRFAKLVTTALIIIVGLYAGSLLAFSVFSRDRLLARGEEKHFCELDCHLAYSIVNSRQTRTLGDPPNQANAQRTYTVVTIKTRFDETTIAPWRGNALLFPNHRTLVLVDENGNRYSPSVVMGTPLRNPLRPSESYTTDVVFDLPANSKPVTLLINESDFVTHLIIGHENSPLHRQAKFQL